MALFLYRKDKNMSDEKTPLKPGLNVIIHVPEEETNEEENVTKIESNDE